MFRDVCDIADSKDGKASTAFGGRLKIPLIVHILIAGTSCIDFSLLNNKKKQIDEMGESGRTFLAFLKYIEQHRPSMVILENVSNAPWDVMKEHFDTIGYSATYVKLDTKKYYIPQTRQRGYLFAVNLNDCNATNSNHTSILENWTGMMGALQRPASSPVSAFLLPNNHPEIRLSKAKLTLQQKHSKVREYRDHKWENCRARHSKEREKLRLGQKRPFTNWKNGTKNIRGPAYCDLPWMRNKTTKRVLDAMDIAALRNATNMRASFDSRYKSRTWTLDQNVDRWTDLHPFGMAECIKPTGMQFETYNGRLIGAHESLRLQGIPAEMISLTTETADQIRRLAGNAMTVPVVAAAILAGLSVGHRVLAATTIGPGLEKDEANSIIKGGSPFWKWDMELSTCATCLNFGGILDAFDTMMAEADASAQRCYCEGQFTRSHSPILICKKCSCTICRKCSGNPAHHFSENELGYDARIKPQAFIKRWKPSFPPVLRLNPCAFLDAFRSSLANQDSLSDQYLCWINTAFRDNLVLTDLRRSRDWSVLYQSNGARLELVLRKSNPMCRVYALPNESWPVNDKLRKILHNPVATAAIDKDLFSSGNIGWKWIVPIQQKFKVHIKPWGPGKCPSWFSNLGLLEHKDDKVSRRLQITAYTTTTLQTRDNHQSQMVDFKDVEETVSVISGIYELLPDCETSCGSLHRKVDEVGSRPIYLFHDPDPTGNPADDPFVFSADPSRLEADQSRNILAYLDSKWRSWKTIPDNGTTVDAFIPGIKICHVSNNTLSVVDTKLHVLHPVPKNPWQNISSVDCKGTVAFLGCTLKVPDTVALQYAASTNGILLNGSDVAVKYLDKMWEVPMDDKSFADTFGWVLKQVSSSYLSARSTGSLGLDTWKDVTNMIDCKPCSTCAPTVPKMLWQCTKRKGKQSLTPYEHPEQATIYETAMKSRPLVFRFKVAVDADKNAHIWAGLNVQTLAHRALQNLGVSNDVNFYCRLTCDVELSMPKSFQALKLRACNELEKAIQPPKMLYLLSSAQLRSLRWMKEQEHPNNAFEIEVIEESVISWLGWKLDVRATSRICLRGGILADEVSFGKTVTSLALIHSEFEDVGHENIVKNMLPRSSDGLINISATLVVCQPTLVVQWFTEIEKFFSCYKHKVIKIDNVNDFQKYTIKSYQGARIVIVNWNVFKSDAYLKAMAHFTAIDEPGETQGRPFNAWMQHALERIPNLVTLLQSREPRKFWEHVQQAQAQWSEHPEMHSYIPSKRIKGALPEAKQSQGKQADKKKPKAEVNLVDRYSKNATQFNEYMGPLLHLFRFNRIILDEFSYLEEPKNSPLLVSITGLKSEKRWALSGTPSLHDFEDIARMASIIGLKLGIEDANPLVICKRNCRNIWAGRTSR